ncbi:hypothetical protein H8K35_14385 [Undibacterium sp. LX40W]|uniref:Tail specific protease domain-containing protein n=1 Tax=Undibacterium nitidum TaxID=2762298 RepID=A0A923HU03_9BURK|nr:MULTISPECIES: S41 family peptidase [Undibacterium]MBC3882577.1 hypothetical protein [Undibacterium nitidum]MBC3892858.1 hypothetical protein [Undibacterium sp. LX40W]
MPNSKIALHTKNSIHFILISVLSLSLFGCGGGSSNTTNVPNTTPISDTSSQPKPLEIISFENKLPQLAMLTKVAHNIEFFHPSDGVADTDWDTFLPYAMYRIAKTNSTDEQVSVLNELFSGIAPSVKFNSNTTGPTFSPDTDLLVWQNTSYVDQNATALEKSDSSYSRKRVSIKAADLGKNPRLANASFARYSVDQISILQPLVLETKAGKTLPASSAFALPKSISLSKSFDNPYQCLASAAKIWAVLDNFWPYFADIEVDWDAELIPLLKSCNTTERASTALDLALRLALTKLQDGHMVLEVPGALPLRFTPNFSLLMVEDKATIIKPDAQGLLDIGDEITEIDGSSVSSLLPTAKRSTLKDTRDTASVALRSLLLRDSIRPIKLSIRKANGEIQSKTFNADTTPTLGASTIERYFYSMPSAVYQVLPNNIHYVNVSRLPKADHADTINKLKLANGIILDMRSYPSSNSFWWEFLSHFSKDALIDPPIYMPYANAPNRANWFRELTGEEVPASLPTLSTNVVALSSRFGISQTDQVLGFAQRAKIKIIGEQTGGINGEVTTIYVRGENSVDLQLKFTGTEVRQLDLSRHIGIGIKPDITVNQSIAGIRAGKDEILETAQQILLRPLGK